MNSPYCLFLLGCISYKPKKLLSSQLGCYGVFPYLVKTKITMHWFIQTQVQCIDIYKYIDGILSNISM